MDPESQARIVRAMVDIYRHEGYLPGCRMGLSQGFTQGGSVADVVIADAFVKSLDSAVPIDWDAAYEAVLADAEIEPANWALQGRGNLTSWKSVGYVPKSEITPTEFDPLNHGLPTRSVSRTIDYAYCDFAISLMSAGMGKSDNATKYAERGRNWANVFDPDTRSVVNGSDTGFAGFVQPRYENGSWGYEEPKECSPPDGFGTCSLNPTGGETYQGSSWQYTFLSAPGDMAGLIETLGGPETTIRRLEFLHEHDMRNYANELFFLHVFMYHYAARPGLSSRRVRRVIPRFFNETIEGLPGDDDSGAMASFVALAMIGLFPNAGQNVYLIIPPFFPSWTITNPQTGKKAIVRCQNFDGANNIYVQNATRDGAPWTRSWIQHDFFTDGGTLELVLGSEESDWGTADEDLPPSASTGGMPMMGRKTAA